MTKKVIRNFGVWKSEIFGGKGKILKIFQRILKFVENRGKSETWGENASWSQRGMDAPDCTFGRGSEPRWKSRDFRHIYNLARQAATLLPAAAALSLPATITGGASQLFVAGKSQVISRIRKGSQHIDIRATLYEFWRFKCFLLYQRLQSSENVEQQA